MLWQSTSETVPNTCEISMRENWFGKCHPHCYVKGNGCFLTHWVRMARIQFNIAVICKSQFKCTYLKNEKLFLNFLFHFRNLHQFLYILKKKMMVIANILPNLETVKILIRPLSKKRSFRKRFDSQHVKVSQKLQISPLEDFYQFFSSFWGKFIWKISLLVLGEI